MSDMKGVVLSGGKGSRLRPFTYTGAKQLVPVANKPILFYAIEQLVEAGITEIAVIVGDTADQICEALGDGERFGCRFTFIRQEAPLGVAHAVKIARDFVGESPFVVYLGDNMLQGGIVPFVESFRSSGADALILVKQMPDPTAFGVVVLDDNGRPVRLVEKPLEPPSDLAMIGVYMFKSGFFDSVARVQPSARGELEITDTVQQLIDTKHDVRAEVVQGGWVDTGKMADILEANRFVLNGLAARTDGAVLERSKLIGDVVVDPGARIVNSVIEGPAIIGEATQIIDSRIGPYTSIYHHCRITKAEIENSIVLERCVIDNPGERIVDSMIGRDVVVRSDGESRGMRLMLGDHSTLDVP